VVSDRFSTVPAGTVTTVTGRAGAVLLAGVEGVPDGFDAGAGADGAGLLLVVGVAGAAGGEAGGGVSAGVGAVLSGAGVVAVGSGVLAQAPNSAIEASNAIGNAVGLFMSFSPLLPVFLPRIVRVAAIPCDCR
jgi:hypothetical protein